MVHSKSPAHKAEFARHRPYGSLVVKRKLDFFVRFFI